MVRSAGPTAFLAARRQGTLLPRAERDDDDGGGRPYDVAPDGRCLINTVLDDPFAPITLLQNWHPDANK